MTVFSQAEMDRRIRGFRKGLIEQNVDVAFLNSADHVFYIGGVPLLSGWGRPMWSVVCADDRATIIGAAIEKENMEKYSSFTDVRPYDDSENVWDTSLKMVVDFLKEGNRAYKRIGLEKDCLSINAYNKLCACFPDAEFVDISQILFDLRIIKSPEEKEILRIGGDVAKIGAAAFLEATTEYNRELYIAGHAVNEMNKAIAALYPQEPGGGTSTYSYCQLADHSLTPHLHPTNRMLHRGDVVALNCFPVIWGYCMELERTFIFGEPNDAQLKALTAITKSAELGRNALKAGVVASEIDKMCHDYMRECGYGDEYFRHGTGHSHGIMIGAANREDMGELRPYNHGKLRAGMALSMEPALYIPELGGFRHSDVMWIEEDGATCLTNFSHDMGNVMGLY